MTREKNSELKNEKILNLITQSDLPLHIIAKETNISFEDLQSLIDEYHKSLDLKLEEDKKERKKIKELFFDIEKELEKRRKEVQSIKHLPRSSKKYASVFNGEKWI
nr:MAG: hypothetical protein [uncultured archaeon]